MVSSTLANGQEGNVIVPNQHGSLSQKAYEQIKHKIVSLELHPGHIIDEGSLIEELQLGRTPIREALKRLSLEKLVTIAPRRGMFVTEIGITDLQRLFEVRLVLECQAARLAAVRGTKAHWLEMEAVLNRLPDGVGPFTNEELIAIDEACHQIIYQATDNVFLRDTLNILYALSLRLWYYALARVGNMETAVLEHQQILQALQQHDRDLAAQLLERHIQTFQEEIQAAMLGK
jgi:DNA-binding GntR family transcriptional regulator